MSLSRTICVPPTTAVSWHGPPVTFSNSNFPWLFVFVERFEPPPAHVRFTVTPTAGVPTASAVPTSRSSACASQLRPSAGSACATATPGPLLIVPRTLCPCALLPAEVPVLFELEPPQPAITTRATAATAHAPILACHLRVSMHSPSACDDPSSDHPGS